MNTDLFDLLARYLQWWRVLEARLGEAVSHPGLRRCEKCGLRPWFQCPCFVASRQVRHGIGCASDPQSPSYFLGGLFLSPMHGDLIISLCTVHWLLGVAASSVTDCASAPVAAVDSRNLNPFNID